MPHEACPPTCKVIIGIVGGLKVLFFNARVVENMYAMNAFQSTCSLTFGRLFLDGQFLGKLFQNNYFRMIIWHH